MSIESGIFSSKNIFSQILLMLSNNKNICKKYDRFFIWILLNNTNVILNYNQTIKETINKTSTQKLKWTILTKSTQIITL